MTILGVGQFVDAGLMEGLAALLTAPRGEAALVLRAALAAGAVACAARAVEVGLEWAWQQAVVSIELGSSDEAFEWLLELLQAETSFGKAGHVVATTGQATKSDQPTPDGAPLVSFRVAARRRNFPHLLWLSWWRPIAVQFATEDGAGTASQRAGARKSETLRLEALRLLGGLELLKDFLESARQRHIKTTQHCTSILTAACEFGSWNAAVERKARRLNSVIHDKAHEVFEDCREFMRPETEAWYAARGIPYRRGYLFHGVPGTGKSSLVFALAGELHARIYCVPLSSAKLEDEGLRDLLASTTPRSFLLLEDVDACGASLRRESVAGEVTEKEEHLETASSSGPTLAGLLNALDGVTAQEGRLLFMTTNRIGMLDAALIRPGRVDVRLEFGYASREELRAFVQHFFGTSLSTAEGLKLSATFADAVPESCVTLAELQGLLLRHRHDPWEAAAQLPSFLQSMAADKRRICRT